MMWNANRISLSQCETSQGCAGSSNTRRTDANQDASVAFDAWQKSSQLRFAACKAFVFVPSHRKSSDGINRRNDCAEGIRWTLNIRFLYKYRHKQIADACRYVAAWSMKFKFGWFKSAFIFFIPRTLIGNSQTHTHTHTQTTSAYSHALVNPKMS